MPQVQGAAANLNVVWPFVLRRILFQPQARRDSDACSWPYFIRAQTAKMWGQSPGRVFRSVAGHLLPALHLFVYTSSQA